MWVAHDGGEPAVAEEVDAALRECLVIGAGLDRRMGAGG